MRIAISNIAWHPSEEEPAAALLAAHGIQGLEVAPIHPFVLEHRISGTEVINEGLYMFEPSALGPQCSAVRLAVYSEHEPDKGDIRVVDQKVLEQIARGFTSL